MKERKRKITSKRAIQKKPFHVVYLLSVSGKERLSIASLLCLE